jgi:hypothetical protein
MTHRQKPGVVFWVTVVLVAISLLYVLGLGHVRRIYATNVNSEAPGINQRSIRAYQRPANFVAEHSPEPIVRALNGYLDVWIE